jgi:nitroimidazol reductase NimA-like FMN-containing flavoprotein (pyridoxamine 5'-phosphate oxidase superfamily)
VTAPVASHRSTAAPSERVRVRRAHKKAAYDPDTIAAILDEALVAHLGFAHEGQPFVIPTLHARIGDRVLVHGSSASRTLRALGGGGLPACLTVTLIDGLVYARSIFEMSTNYRSVVVLGEGTPVTDFDEKMEALHAFSEQVMPGRWDAVRRPTRQEVKATAILSLPLSEASAKVSSGGPDDGASPDAALPVWAGHVPVRMVAGDPVPCPHLPPGIPVPDELVRAALRP